MSQATLADDELFGEAAEEVRADVEDHLESARSALPETDEVWEVEAANALGVVNGLRSALDVGDATDHLRQAKKWYTMGERAGAFDDGDDDLGEEIDALADLVTQIESTNEAVADLATSLPELKGALDEVATDDADGGAETGDDTPDGTQPAGRSEADDAEADTEGAAASDDPETIAESA